MFVDKKLFKENEEATSYLRCEKHEPIVLTLDNGYEMTLAIELTKKCFCVKLGNTLGLKTPDDFWAEYASYDCHMCKGEGWYLTDNGKEMKRFNQL